MKKLKILVYKNWAQLAELQENAVAAADVGGSSSSQLENAVADVGVAVPRSLPPSRHLSEASTWGPDATTFKQPSLQHNCYL